MRIIQEQRILQLNAGPRASYQRGFTHPSINGSDALIKLDGGAGEIPKCPNQLLTVPTSTLEFQYDKDSLISSSERSSKTWGGCQPLRIGNDSVKLFGRVLELLHEVKKLPAVASELHRISRARLLLFQGRETGRDRVKAEKVNWFVLLLQALALHVEGESPIHIDDMREVEARRGQHSNKLSQVLLERSPSLLFQRTRDRTEVYCSIKKSILEASFK